MKVHIYKKVYNIDPALMATAKSTINQTLEYVKMRSEEMDIKSYYLVFVIMMYTISASILKSIGPDSITDALKDQKKGKNVI